MPYITIISTGKTYSYETGKTLLEILLENGIFVDNPCNGKGVCGKCKVRVTEGDAGEICETERSLLKQEEAESGVRLSCLVQPKSDLKIELLQKERKHEVLTDGYVPEFVIEPDITKQVIELQKPTLDDQTPYEEQLCEKLPGVEVPFSAISGTDFTEGMKTAVIHEKKDRRYELLAVEEGDTTQALYGAAIDIGTTTVVTSLVDMRSGRELAHASMINAQKHFGLDVLTRITYELEHREDGIRKLQGAIVQSINDMVADICHKAGIEREQIYEVTVGANCTMMHMLLGVDAASLGKAPYAPVFVSAKDIPAESIGIHAAKGARLYCLPSVSAYIGADIVAGAYVCELHKTKENVLFIDIGTNGEIVFSNHGRLLCCSCAAGPALEGMNISSGMRAAEGAIEDVHIHEDGVELQVIGEKDPEGICGSGILAVVKELIKHGFVKKGGAFVKLDKLEETDWRRKMLQKNGVKREFVMTKSPRELLITQGDIRQVQLAKGAILSGFYALLAKAGKTMEELDCVMVAGQFGAHLPAESLIGVGILPDGIQDKLVYVGNSSKTGAYLALLSRDAKREMEKLARHMDYMELGATEGYERLFAECLNFPTQEKNVR